MSDIRVLEVVEKNGKNVRVIVRINSCVFEFIRLKSGKVFSDLDYSFSRSEVWVPKNLLKQAYKQASAILNKKKKEKRKEVQLSLF